MWVDLGICGPTAFVWEDVVDGSEGDHDEGEGEGGAGGVEAIGPVDDQAYAPVESFVAGVVDAQPDRGQDPGPSFADGAGEGDERFQAAALCFGAEPVQQERDVGFVQV